MKFSSQPSRSRLLLLTLSVVLVGLSGCLAPGYNAREAMLFEDKMHTEYNRGQSKRPYQYTCTSCTRGFGTPCHPILPSVDRLLECTECTPNWYLG